MRPPKQKQPQVKRTLPSAATCRLHVTDINIRSQILGANTEEETKKPSFYETQIDFKKAIRCQWAISDLLFVSVSK